MSNLTLLHPAWLIGAALLALAALFWRGQFGHDAWRRVMSAPVFDWLTGAQNKARRRLHPALAAAALAAAALAGPAIPGTDEPALRHAQGWIIAIDVSRSMSLDDVAPSRLAAARDVAEQIVQFSGSRPLALILFAGDAYLAGPLTFDKRHTLDILRTLQTGVVPIDGSDLRRALALSASAIDQAQLVQARVLVLTDAHGDLTPVLPTAAAIARAGHRLDLITIGTAAGTAATVNRPTNMKAAAALANAGGGIAVHADALGQVDLTALALNESAWRRNRFVQSAFATLAMQNLSHWVLLLALPLVLLMFIRRQA